MKSTRHAYALIAAALVVLTGCGAAEPSAPQPPPASAPVPAPAPTPIEESPRGPSDTERAEAVTRENQIAYAAGLRVYANYDYAADGSGDLKFLMRDAVRLCDYIDRADGVDPVVHAARRFNTDEQRAAAIVEYTVENFCTIPGVRKG